MATALALPAAAGAETRPDLVLTAGQHLAVTFDQPAGVVTCPAVPVVVTGGPVSLGDATLDIATTVPPGAGYGCMLIDNRGTAAVAGTFAGLPEGTVFGPPSARFRITYAGGDGNDVQLKRVEVPTTIAITDDLRPWYTGSPASLHVYVGGDTPTSLAASGTVTVSLDGATLGTFPLQHADADVLIDALGIGDHVLTVSYSGGSYGGDLVYLPATVSRTITINPVPPLPPTVLPGGPPPPPMPAQGSGPQPPSAPARGDTGSTPPSSDSAAAPREPAASEIRAALRAVKVAGASLSRRRVSFVQKIAAAGTVRWRLLVQTRGREIAVATDRRTVKRRGSVHVQLTLGSRARKVLRPATAARLVLETTLATRGGRTVVVRTPVGTRLR